ncbi:hypothetical protein BH23ACT6_BH23ACT6_10910 [soil metagenome]
MFAVGLILVILALIVVVYVMFATSGLEPMSIDWGVFTADLTPLQLFFLGATTIVVMAIGTLMLSIGLKKQGEKRAEVKRLRKEVKKGQEEQPRDGGEASGEAVGSTVPMDKNSATRKSKTPGASSRRTTSDSSSNAPGSAAKPAKSSPTGPVQSTRPPSDDKPSGSSTPPPPARR